MKVFQKKHPPEPTIPSKIVAELAFYLKKYMVYMTTKISSPMVTIVKKLTKPLQEALGLSPKESAVYLAALELGAASMTKLAKKAKMPRTSAYTIVSELVEQGFLTVFRKPGHHLYVPVSPTKLLGRIGEQQEHFQRMLPTLQKLANKHTLIPDVRVIEGEEGVKTTLREILEEKRPFRAIVCIADMHHLMEAYFDDFITKRIKQRLKVQLLTNRDITSQKLKQFDGKELRTTRFLPIEKQFHTANYIFGNKVALLSLKQDPPVTVIIDDADIAHTHAMYFDLLWETAETN